VRVSSIPGNNLSQGAGLTRNISLKSLLGINFCSFLPDVNVSGFRQNSLNLSRAGSSSLTEARQESASPVSPDSKGFQGLMKAATSLLEQKPEAVPASGCNVGNFSSTSIAARPKHQALEEDLSACIPRSPFALDPDPDSNLLVMGAAGLPPAMQRPMWHCTDYGAHQHLGTGAAAVVYGATCKLSCERVLLKVYDLQELDETRRVQLHREIAIHSRLDHPGIIKLYAAFMVSHGDFLWAC
jgi:hypothetical protein